MRYGEVIDWNCKKLSDAARRDGDNGDGAYGRLLLAAADLK